MDATALVLDRATEWLAEYDRENVSPAGVLCDRHVASGRIALFSEDAAGNRRSLTYGELREQSERFAGVLRGLGVGRGDRVATLLPKTPELVVTVLAIWRLGAVHVPLFTAFGPEAIAYRLDRSEARAVVTDGANRDKIGPSGASPRVIVVEPEDGMIPSGDIGYRSAMNSATPVKGAATLSGADPMILIYTSGTTGHPKGVAVPVKALAAFQTYMHFGLDLRGDDVFWNAADPGWAYGLYYALIGPLLLGQSTLFVDASFEAERTERIWRTYGVTNFAAAPTVYRALRAAGVPAQGRDGLRLRVASSAGEPLNPDVIRWAQESLGVPLHDQYGQSEHGMVINNHHHPALRRPSRSGSMGHAMPGFAVVILDSDGNEVEPGREGQLAIDVSRSPLFWFAGYHEDADATARCFSADGRYYRSGDAACRDAEGYITFSGRSDDLINSAGYRIGPFEVESALVGHPAVAEAAVVGKPDALRGEVVTAFVVVRPGVAPSPELGDELGRFVKGRLGGHAYPREVTFVPDLPKTPSGKIQRFKLRGGVT